MTRALAAAVAVVLAGAVLAGPVAAADAQRQADVRERGAGVMPFDPDATVHVFTKTRDGGVERVVARLADDPAQVRLVRSHLRDIRAEFARGDFAAPSAIHGGTMPGLAALQAAPHGAVRIAYRDTPGGAELRYAARDPALVQALHAWFDAQLADHGSDAVEGGAVMHHDAGMPYEQVHEKAHEQTHEEGKR